MSAAAAPAAAGIDIRPALKADVPAIAAIWYDGWRQAHTGHVPEALLRFRSRETFDRRAGDRLDDAFVAASNGVVAGFLRVHDDEIEQVFVAGSFQGTGLARSLMQAGESLLSRRGIAIAFLVVNEANARAIRFYENCGWQSAGLIDYAAETGDGEMIIPVLRYEKTLHHSHSHEEF